MAGVTAVTALNTFNGGFITASRFIYGTAREGSLPRQLAHLNDRAVPWVPVVVLGAVSAVVALLVALTHAWQVLVAVGAALEGMIYAVAGFCTLRLRRRQPDTPRPFRFRGLGVLGPLGIVLFALLAVTASVSVQNKFDPAPLVIILVGRRTQRLLRAAGPPGHQGARGGPPGRPAAAPARPLSRSVRSSVDHPVRAQQVPAGVAGLGQEDQLLDHPGERHALGLPEHGKHGDGGEAGHGVDLVDHDLVVRRAQEEVDAGQPLDAQSPVGGFGHPLHLGQLRVA